MSKLKDKLSANMRMVKANQQSPAAAPAKVQAAAKPNKKAVTKPSATAPAAKTAPRPAARPAVPGDVPDSGTALFPSRVWPD